jgi:biopolymer transport protein TolR
MAKRNHLGADRVVRPELPRLFTTINMAPFSCILMVKVVLISLSFGLLTQTGLDVSLPEVALASLDAYTMQVVVEISADGVIAVNNTPIAIEALERRLRAIVAGRRDKTVFVIGAGSLRYGDVVPLIDAARGAGASVGIVTERMLATSRAAPVYSGRQGRR